MNYYDGTLVDTVNGMQFKVYANNHPDGFVIAKPKYIPESMIAFKDLKKRFIFGKCMTRFNLFNNKAIVEYNLKKIKETIPECIYYCKKHNNWFLGVPVSNIKKAHDVFNGLKELMKVPLEDLDQYLKSTRGMIELIMAAGVSADNLGISHSTLLGNYTPGKSDIDIIVLGKENGWKVMKFLETVKHPSLRWKNKKDWAKYYKDRVVSKFFCEEEYVANMVRKKDDGFFDGNVFSIFCVEKPEEQWYDWDAYHEPLATVKIRAKIKDAYNSIVRPGYYELENSEIIELIECQQEKSQENEVLQENVDLPVSRIVTWSRPFVLQAREGDMVEAVGLLEKVTSNGKQFYQVVLGYFDAYTTERGEREYMKFLIDEIYN